jgi:hypothetical protein
MVEFLREHRPVIERERAADLGKDLGWGDRAGPPVSVGQQVLEELALVGVGDHAA